jgi:DNA-binding NarL/FixJ family response regulator
MLTTVLIVDDQPLQRMGMRMFLTGQDDLEVVGEAGDGGAAIAAAATLHPDVVLLDIRMPGIDGITATRSIITAHTDPTTAPRVLLLTTFDLDDYVISGLEAGASGFLTKDSQPEAILAAIRAIAAGDAVLTPSATRRLLDRIATNNTPTTTAHSDLPANITPRERDILTAIGKGMANREIADHLYLAESTVKNYIGRIFTKLGARDRVHAAIIAYRAGLVDPHQHPH